MLPLILLLCLMPFGDRPEQWQTIQLSENGKPIATLKAMGIKAKAECKGQSYTAFVVVWGRQGSGIYSVGTIINDFDGTIPDGELDEYRGPDLSERATKKNSIRISVRNNKGIRIFSTRLVMGTTLMLPIHVRGSSEEYFVTNPNLGSKTQRKEWNELLDILSNEIVDGDIVIGEGNLSKKIVVRFGGAGVESLAKALMRFIAVN